MSDERLEAGEPCMVSISAGLRPIHKKAVVTAVKPKGYDVLCEGETTERHISEKKAKRLSGRKVTPPLTYADIKGARAVLEANSIQPNEAGIVAVPLVCTECHKYAGRCPRCHRKRPSVEQVVRSLKPVPKPRPRWRSAEYLKFVGEHDCCGCGKHGPSDAHHWGGSKGMALKVDDLLTVPLCNDCHIEGFHRTGKLPGMTTAETHLRFRETQVALLVEWVLRKFQEVDE